MIYKPTDLSPSAQTFDVMDTPIFFECKVDTSNVQASGFTIEILDSENNVVFSSIPKGEQLNINYITIIDDLREYVHTYFPDYETGYSLLNTGYNGSYLKFPFSVSYDSKADDTNTSVINQIFYIPPTETIPKGVDRSESGLYRNNYKLNGNNYEINSDEQLIPVKIYNGKEYKWSITLYQLENVGTTKNPVWILPENPLMFDMPMTTGTVLGSNNKRIQSAFSEEIYGDYFIQPLWIEGLNYSAGEEDRWTYKKLNDSETWNKSTIYNIKDYVKVTNEDTNTEKYYRCIKQTNNNIEITNTEYWKEVEQITQIGSRVAIKSYDMSFGYIYPVEGDDGFQTGTIKNDVSNAFRIYKNGNNSENLTAYQKVNFVANKALDENTAAEWSINTEYMVNDIVIYNNNAYQCMVAYNPANISHIPGKNEIYWKIKTDDDGYAIIVSRWADGESLDYCKHNSAIYNRRKSIPYIYPKLSDNNISDFNTSTIYSVGDIVKNISGEVTNYYKCIKQTTVNIEITNPEYWEVINSSPYWAKKDDISISSFDSSIIYNVDSIVKSTSGGATNYYKCIKQTTANIEITNPEYWENITFNLYKNYSTSNLVGYSESVYSCIKKIDQTPFNGSAYWNLISYKNISYNKGNIVGYTDNLYECQKSYDVNDPKFNIEPSLYGYNDNKSISDTNKSSYWSLYNGSVWKWNESLANQGESYGTFTYYSSTKPEGVYTLPDGVFPSSVYGGERIVLNNQIDGASKDNDLGSPYNGIYTIDISSQYEELYEEYSSTNTYTEGYIVKYNGVEYCCTGVVSGVKPGETDNWSKYWVETQFSAGATDYNNDTKYKKNDIVQIQNDSDEENSYSYYTCLGTVFGQTPSEDSIYWVKNDRNGYRVTIRFNRAPDADSWGELMTKIVYVSGGNIFYGKNIQIKAPNKDGTIDTSDGYGVINQTPFKFIEEEPVEIYKYSFDEYDNSKLYKAGDVVLYNNKKYMCIKNTITDIDISNTEYWEDRTNDIINTTGLIFYNNPITTNNKNGILYIRYFEGIQKGMMLQKLSSDNKCQYFIIDDVGTNGGMYLKYHEVKEFNTHKSYTISDAVANSNPTKLTADTTWDIDETKYQIKTYFRESDENAFYFYSRPLVNIQFENTAGVNFVTGRTPYVAATIWEASRTYSKGDYVYVDDSTSRKYFLCKSDSGVSSDTAPSETDENWDLLTTGINIYKDNVNYKKDTIVSYEDIYYIALTNISQSANPVKPEGKNLGIFWEVYVGTLYKEDIGFYYSLYNELRAYKEGDIVFDQGIYYIVSEDIKSEPPTENANLWGLFTDIDTSAVDYPINYIGFIDGECRILKNIEEYDKDKIYNKEYIVKVTDKGATKYYKCIKQTTSNIDINNNEYWNEISYSKETYWALVTGANGDEQYKDGLRVKTDGSLYTDFVSNEVYTVAKTVFYNGLKYQMRILSFNESTDYDPGEYVTTGEQDNLKYYLCTEKVSGTKQDPSLDTAHWREVETVSTAPLLEDEKYYKEYDSWKDTTLYQEGDLVLFNNIYYVYINDNRNKRGIYKQDLSYQVGDLAKILDIDNVYKWKYCKVANPIGTLIEENWVDIKPNYPDGAYNSNEFWTEYYGFLYVGNYEENTNSNTDPISSYVDYNYNNVVYYNNQYYIYVNPGLKGITSEQFRGQSIDTSLTRLKDNISLYRTGSPGYNVGDIVLYNNKYYICYKETTEYYFSPTNRNYWTLYPWQTFIAEISERTVVCSAEYKQQQYIQWKSVQWFLYDATGKNILDKSDVIYDGDLRYTFHGVDGREKGKQEDVIFIVRLVLETRTGYRLTIDKKIKAIYEIEEVNSEGLIDAHFDCDTMSVVTVVTKESGFIVPTIEGDNTIVIYSEGGTNGEMTVDGEVDYAKVLYSLEYASSVDSAANIISNSERFELQSEQKIDTDYFSGYLTRIQTAIDGQDKLSWNKHGDFGIFIPELLIKVPSTSKDDFNKNKEILLLNPNRNTIYWEAKDINNGSYYEGGVQIRKNDDSGEKLSEDGILTGVYKYSLCETASNYQPKNFANIYGIMTDYNSEYNLYPNTNYLPITYAKYFKDSSFNYGTTDKYNAETPYNIYDTQTFSLPYNITDKANIPPIGMNIKRINDPVVSRNQFITNSNGEANKFDLTGFNVSGNNDSGLQTDFYIPAVAPTLISDYAYSETYGVVEGLKYISLNGTPMIFYRQKNVLNDFSSKWTEADGGTIECSFWNDGEFITNGDSLSNKSLGYIAINDSLKDYVKDVEDVKEPVYNNTMLLLQERMRVGGDDLKIVAERRYLNGKKFIINADLVMDGDGGLTPYPGDTDMVDSVIIYVDDDL